MCNQSTKDGTSVTVQLSNDINIYIHFVNALKKKMDKYLCALNLKVGAGHWASIVLLSCSTVYNEIC